MAGVAQQVLLVALTKVTPKLGGPTLPSKVGSKMSGVSLRFDSSSLMCVLRMEFRTANKIADPK